MAWAKAALMTFSEDMLIRRSQSQSLCSYAFTLSRPSKKDVHNWSLTAVFSFLSQCGALFSVFFFSSAQHSMVMHGVITESFHWPFFSITKKAPSRWCGWETQIRKAQQANGSTVLTTLLWRKHRLLRCAHHEKPGNSLGWTSRW